MPCRHPATLVCLLLASLAIGCGSDDEDVAVEASTQWLAVIDSGQLRLGWEQTAGVFRNNVSAENFEKMIQEARAPLGKLISRKVRTAQAARALPNAPRGRYVVVQYDSIFENQPVTVETVTEMFENGVWRVSGYRSR